MEEKKNIPQDLDPVQISTRVNAPVQKVWEALTDPAQMRKWYFDVDLDSLQDGDTFKFYEPGDEKKFLHECLILEMVEPSKFRHTWAYPELSQGSSTVNWDLEDHGEQTDVILTHEGIHHLYDAGDAVAKQNFIDGWTEILGKMLPDYLVS